MSSRKPRLGHLLNQSVTSTLVFVTKETTSILFAKIYSNTFHLIKTASSDWVHNKSLYPQTYLKLGSLFDIRTVNTASCPKKRDIQVILWHKINYFPKNSNTLQILITLGGRRYLVNFIAVSWFNVFFLHHPCFVELVRAI